MIRRAAALAAALVPLASCAGTTFDVSATTIAPSQTTTTTVPTGPADELLRRMAVDVSALSGLIVEDRDEQHVLERIEVLWAASRPQVEADHPDLLDAFDRTVALCRTAVERRRPADADKASKNLTTLLAGSYGAAG